MSANSRLGAYSNKYGKKHFISIKKNCQPLRFKSFFQLLKKQNKKIIILWERFVITCFGVSLLVFGINFTSVFMKTFSLLNNGLRKAFWRAIESSEKFKLVEETKTFTLLSSVLSVGG